ncbi:hypothetical protein M2138_001568 [Dysgonomonadaceae bacterium PH5-43]|nr:hypothetical protein [Dysgonomonadaceae bacterium PH5-43]
MITSILTTAIEFLLISGVLMVFYYLLFKNKGSFVGNRVYLISIPVIALIISVITIPLPADWVLFQKAAKQEYTVTDNNRVIESNLDVQALEEIVSEPASEGAVVIYNEPITEVAITPTVTPAKETKINKEINYASFTPYIYVGVMFLYLVLLFIHLYKIKLLRKRSEREDIGNIKIYKSKVIKNPFSFMREIYLPSESNKDKQHIIITHEQFHISNYHYIDMALLELFTVIFWFNPVMWLIRYEIRLTHEFQVDDCILRNGIEREIYMSFILEETAGFLPAMANGFNTSLIKKRFIKMKTGNQIRYKRLRVVLMTPMLVMLLAFFSFKPVAQAQTVVKKETVKIVEDVPPPPPVKKETKTVQFTPPTVKKVKIVADVPPPTVKKETVKISLKNTDTGSVSSLETNKNVDNIDIVEKNDTTYVYIDNSDEALVKIPLKNSKPADDFIDPSTWNYEASGLTFNTEDNKYYNPDGVVLSKGDINAAKNLDAYYLARNEVTLVPPLAAEIYPTMNIKSIEEVKGETRVTTVTKIHWPSNWLFTDKNACLIDSKTNTRYKIRDVEAPYELGRMFVVMGLKGAYIERVLIFPPLDKGVKTLEYYSPPNRVDLPDNSTNGTGTHIQNIDLEYYKKQVNKIVE